MNKPNLEIILNNINYESADDVPCAGAFEEEVKQQLPGYDVTVIDMDEYGAIESIGDTIAATVKNQFVEDIQTMQWCTEEEDVYYYVVAIKLKGE